MSHLKMGVSGVDREGLNRAMRAAVQDARRRLDESRRAGRSMFDASPFASILFDDQLRLVDCNEASVRYFGFGSREELIESSEAFMRSCVPMVDPIGTRPQTLEDRLRIAAQHGSDSFETMLHLDDGRQIPLNIALKRVEFSGSYFIALFHTDISDLKETQVELRRHEQLLHAINQVSALLMSSTPAGFDWIMRISLEALAKVIDADRATIWIPEPNGRLTPVFEWYEREWSTEQMPDAQRMPRVPHWYAKLAGGRTVDILAASAPEPERGHMAARGAKSVLTVPIMMNGSMWGILGFEHCRSAIILHESERSILQNAGLLIAASIVRNDMANDLRSAHTAALQNAEAKSAFLANISHEIRTPMNAIMGMTAIARSALDDREKVSNCLDQIEAAGRRMMTLLSDLIDMSRLESKTMTVEEAPFSMRELVYGVVVMHQIKMEERGQRIYTKIDSAVRDALIGDAQRIGQVLSALVSNALKFSPDGETIRIEVRLVENWATSTRVMFIVQDNGVGISDEERERLFEAFGRGASTQYVSGLGLGLSLARSIVELMGGRMTVNSALGQGSRFSFDLTLRNAPDDALPATDDADDDIPLDVDYHIEYDFSGKTIMVVDDVEINREIVDALMGDTGAETVHAANGRECVDLFMADPKRWDLIFMDVNMPVMDGLEATRAIRASGAERCDTVPIVAITANSFAEDVDRCIAAGMNDHIAKPVDPSVMMEKARTHAGGTARKIIDK